jgi:hypothetical protein
MESLRVPSFACSPQKAHGRMTRFAPVLLAAATASILALATVVPAVFARTTTTTTPLMFTLDPSSGTGRCLTEPVTFEGSVRTVLGDAQWITIVKMTGVGLITGDRYISNHEQSVISITTNGGASAYTEEYHSIIRHAGPASAGAQDGIRASLIFHATTTPQGDLAAYVERPTSECF